MEELASAFGIDRRTAGNHVKRRGVPSRSRKFTDEQVQEAITLYDSGWSLARIAKHVGIHPESVRYRLRKCDVTLRPRSGRS